MCPPQEADLRIHYEVMISNGSYMSGVCKKSSKGEAALVKLWDMLSVCACLFMLVRKCRSRIMFCGSSIVPGTQHLRIHATVIFRASCEYAHCNCRSLDYTQMLEFLYRMLVSYGYNKSKRSSRSQGIEATPQHLSSDAAHRSWASRSGL